MEDIAIVLHFFVCSSHRPQRLCTPFVGAGHKDDKGAERVNGEDVDDAVHIYVHVVLKAQSFSFFSVERQSKVGLIVNLIFRKKQVQQMI